MQQAPGNKTQITEDGARREAHTHSENNHNLTLRPRKDNAREKTGFKCV